MTRDSRSILRDYYDEAAHNYLDRASSGLMGWMRKRELALTLSMIPEKGYDKAIDAGCGPGYYSQVLRDRGFDVTAVDISPAMVDRVKSLGFPAFVMDIEHSAPPAELTAPFSFIFCAGVLEFAEDISKFLGALRALSTDDGEILLVAPLKGLFGRIYKIYLEKRGIPARVYTGKSLAKDLAAVGFEALEIRSSWPICLIVRARAIKE